MSMVGATCGWPRAPPTVLVSPQISCSILKYKLADVHMPRGPPSHHVIRLPDGHQAQVSYRSGISSRRLDNVSFSMVLLYADAV